MWNWLNSDLHALNPTNAIDAACHGFTNRRFFTKHQYFGLDISIQRLSRGLGEKGHDMDIGILGDLTMDIPDVQNFGVVVSTKTLSHVSKELRLRAVKNLVHLTCSEGVLLLDVEFLSDLDRFLDYLYPHFRKIEILYYRTMQSKAFEDKGLATLRSPEQYEKIRKLTFEYELNEPNIRSLHCSAYLRCLNRKETSASLKWDLKKFGNKILAMKDFARPSVKQFLDEMQEKQFIAQVIKDHNVNGKSVFIVLPNNAICRDYQLFCERVLSSKIPRGIRFLSVERDEDFESCSWLILCAFDESSLDEGALYYPKLNASTRRQMLYRLRRYAMDEVTYVYCSLRDGLPRQPSPWLNDV